MSQTKFKYPYAISRDGTPDLSTFQIKKSLAPLIEALNTKRIDEARKLSSALKNPRATKIAGILLSRNDAKGPISQSTQLVALTRLTPTSEKVGWGRPSYDKLPGPSPLLESGSKIFATGIYAHAPSLHQYKLNKKWSKLEGTVGLAAGKSGSVRFEVKGDGKSLWRSPVMKEGQLKTFSLNIRAIMSLELITETTSDGAASDWGLWLEPTLKR